MGGKRVWLLKRSVSLELPYDAGSHYPGNYGHNYWTHTTIHESLDHAKAYLKPGGVIYEVEVKRTWDGIDPTAGHSIARERK